MLKETILSKVANSRAGELSGAKIFGFMRYSIKFVYFAYSTEAQSKKTHFRFVINSPFPECLKINSFKFNDWINFPYMKR